MVLDLVRRERRVLLTLDKASPRSGAAPLVLEGAMGLDTPAEPISRCTAAKAPAEPRYDEGSGRGANSSAPVGM